MKKYIIAVLVIGICCFVGYLGFDHFFINRTSDLDNKTLVEQQETILAKQEFKDLPEVVALKNQVDYRNFTGKVNGSGIQNPKLSQTETPEGVKKPSGQAPSQVHIESQLRKKLLELQAEYTGKLVGLVSAAKKDYQMIQSGKRSGSKKELAQKYIGIAQGMEAQCDARVYAAIAYANNELSQYGYKSSVPNEARNSYLRSKSQMRQRLLSKI